MAHQDKSQDSVDQKPFPEMRAVAGKSLSIQPSEVKDKMYLHSYPPSKGVPRYLRPGTLARFRDATQLLRAGHYMGSDAHKRPRYNEAALVLGRDVDGSSGELHIDRVSQLVLALPRASAPINGHRKKHFAPRVIPRHAGGDTVGTSHAAEGSQQAETVLALENSREDKEEFRTEPETTFHDLPLEMLIRIVCYLRHSELKVAFSVCKSMMEAAKVARLLHFNYTTPDHRHDCRASRCKHNQRALYQCAVEAAEAAAQAAEALGPGCLVIPQAPRHAPRPAEARVASAEMRKIAAPLFQATPKHPPRPALQNTPKQTPYQTAGRPPGLPRGPSSLSAPHRALFNVTEDDLCVAVENQSLCN